MNEAYYNLETAPTPSSPTRVYVRVLRYVQRDHINSKHLVSYTRFVLCLRYRDCSFSKNDTVKANMSKMMFHEVYSFF